MTLESQYKIESMQTMKLDFKKGFEFPWMKVAKCKVDESFRKLYYAWKFSYGWVIPLASKMVFINTSCVGWDWTLGDIHRVLSKSYIFFINLNHKTNTKKVALEHDKHDGYELDEAN